MWKKNHLARVCAEAEELRNLFVNTNTTTTAKADEVYMMVPFRSTKYEPIYAVVQVNKVPTNMEIDIYQGNSISYQ